MRGPLRGIFTGLWGFRQGIFKGFRVLGYFSRLGKSKALVAAESKALVLFERHNLFITGFNGREILDMSFINWLQSPLKGMRLQGFWIQEFFKGCTKGSSYGC